jgi:hypothetical protein
MLRLGKFTDLHAPDPLESSGTYHKDPPAKNV